MNLRRTIALACLTASAPVFAAETYHIHIEPQPLTTALQQFATQSGLQIIYFGQITDAYSADAVVGNLSAVEILNRLLAGTDLTYEALDRDTIAITDSRTQSGSSTQGAIKNVESIRLAQNDAPSERFEGTPHGGQTEEHAASTMRSASSDVGLTSLEEVVVLGTSIKGVAPAGSPVLIYGREEIESTGSATVAQFIERLPQNFGNINSASLDNSVPNIGRGTGVNLRGIGSRTTLTLVNGRRMALVGMGQMTDISLIPVGAIERIEVLPDGASAIYGSDAVAGVVNIVLRKDYAGAESHVRAESRLNGNSMLYVADQALGTAWSSGSGTFSFGYQRDEPIQAADRDYMNAGAVHEITPKQTRYSGTASLRQDLGERIELFFDGHYGFRETDNWHQPGAQNAAVHALTDSDQINMSAGVDYSVTPSWSMLADVAYGYSHSRLTNSLNSRSDYRSRVTTFRATANGPLMSLPAGDLKIAFGVDVRRERNSRVDPYLDAIAPTPPLDRDVDAAFLEFSLPIFDALTASLAGRHERYSDFGSTTNPKLGLSWDVTSELTVRGTFSTSFSVSRLADSLTGFNIGFIQEIESPRCDDNRCLVLSDLGYRDSYDPERAKTYNIGFDYSPHWAEGLAVQASYYRIKYIDRIGHLPNRSVLLNNAHRFSEVVMSSPPGAFVETTIDRMMRGYVNGALDLVGAYDVNDFDYFIDERMTNLAESETDGLDLAIGYSRPWGERTIGIELAGTYILDYTNTAFPTSPSTPGINRVGLPSDLKLTAAFSLSTPRYAINLLLRHIGDYIDNRAAQSFKVSSWTTADLHASFSVGDRFGGRADDLVLAVTLRNMFDRDPPYVRGDGFYDFGYDSANASAEGRVLAVDVRKRW